MRRYDDPVDVRRGRVRGAGGAVEAPEQFLWKGRLWKVSAVVAQWVETGAWWQSSGVHAVLGADETDAATRTDLSAEREVWRGGGAPGGGGPPPPGGGGVAPGFARAPGGRGGSPGGRCGGSRPPGAGPSTPTRAPGSSTWSSTGPRAAGGSPGAWTEEQKNDPAAHPAARPVRPAGRDALLPPASRHLAPRGDDRPRRIPALRLRARRRLASHRGADRGPGDPDRHAPPRQAEERLGPARRDRARAQRVGGVLLRRCGEASSRRGRLPSCSH